jgi:predicted metalloprotease with PDZ domain
VKTYTFEDVVAAMNEVYPYDWRTFFTERVNRVQPHPPMGGITNGGWKMAFVDSVPAYHKSLEHARKRIDLRYSIGLYLTDEGEVLDLIPGAPAAKAGLSPGMKVIALNGKQFTPDVIHDAIKAAARTRKPIEILTKNGEFYATFRVTYTGGERYPKLMRVAGAPDLVGRDLQPLTGTAERGAR